MMEGDFREFDKKLQENIKENIKMDKLIELFLTTLLTNDIKIDWTTIHNGKDGFKIVPIRIKLEKKND